MPKRLAIARTPAPARGWPDGASPALATWSQTWPCSHRRAFVGRIGREERRAGVPTPAAPRREPRRSLSPRAPRLRSSGKVALGRKERWRRNRLVNVLVRVGQGGAGMTGTYASLSLELFDQRCVLGAWAPRVEPEQFHLAVVTGVEYGGTAPPSASRCDPPRRRRIVDEAWRPSP